MIRTTSRRRRIIELPELLRSRITTMTDSLRDQLLKSGLVKPSPPARAREERRSTSSPAGKPARKGGQSKPHTAAQAARTSSREQGDIDLARAYALRAQTEASERKRIEQATAEQARLRRARKLQIQQLLDGKALNKVEADQPRHFEYGGKIRRVHVDAAQLQALNAGDLGVVQQGGRYLLVSRAVAEQVREIDPHQLALLVEVATGDGGDDGVPDDLMW
jgi:uncharacterized protein YaiL (DUF2058 family)